VPKKELTHSPNHNGKWEKKRRSRELVLWLPSGLGGETRTKRGILWSKQGGGEKKPSLDAHPRRGGTGRPSKRRIEKPGERPSPCRRMTLRRTRVASRGLVKGMSGAAAQGILAVGRGKPQGGKENIQKGSRSRNETGRSRAGGGRRVPKEETRTPRRPRRRVNEQKRPWFFRGGTTESKRMGGESPEKEEVHLHRQKAPER